jgi:RimJ/RimL family protein N-acetyltransferase
MISRYNPLANVFLVLKYVEYHGWFAVFKKIWKCMTGAFFQKKSVYIMKLLVGDAECHNPGIVMKELKECDINQMLDVMYVSSFGLRERFNQGDRCFVVLDNQKIVSYFWAKFNVRQMSDIFLEFKLCSKQTWFYNAVTVGGYRGRGYYPNLINYMVKVLKEEGVNEFFIDVDENNVSSIRGMQKAGYKPIVKIVMKKLLSRKKYKFFIQDRNKWNELSEMLKFPDEQNLSEEYINGN